MKKTQEMIDRAIETFDHLLWEAIIRICGSAKSLAFFKYYESTSIKIRINYEILVDPRELFNKIQRETKLLINKVLSIRLKETNITNMEKDCSRQEYYHLFETTIDWDYPLTVVEIGHPHSEDYISCFCCGPHLTNTLELKKFQITLKPPIRKGKNQYAFVFIIKKKVN